MAKVTRKKTAMKSANGTKHRRGGRTWSAKVTRESHALALDKGVFTLESPRAIARSLKRSAERSHVRKIRAAQVGTLDAVFLYQSCRCRPLGEPAQDAGSGQGRASQAVRQRQKPASGVIASTDYR